jgi:hypothetical protein
MGVLVLLVPAVVCVVGSMMLNLAWDTILMVTWFFAGYILRGIRDERAAIKKMLDEAAS